MMILRMTVSDADTRENRDVEVVAAPASSVRTLLASLPIRTAGRECFVGATRLDPHSSIADSPLVSGVVVAVGGPGPAFHPDPGTLGTIQVVSGPDNGFSIGLGPGRHLVARDPRAAVCLRDTDVSRKHAELQITVQGDAVIADLGSANGTYVGDVLITGPTPLSADAVVRVGNNQLRWIPTPTTGLLTTRTQDGHLEFDRAFAPVPAIPRTEVTLPAGEAPESHNSAGMWLTGLLPVAGGIVTAMAMHQPAMLGMSLLGLAGPMVMTNSADKEKKAQAGELANARKAVYRVIAAHVAEERQARELLAPGPAAIARLASGEKPDLWPRGAHSPHGLTLRVGTANLPASVDLRGEPWHGFPYPVIKDLPLTVDLRATGVLGVIGTGEPVRALLRWLLIQLGTLRAPDELRIVLITATRGDDVAWARWLPHLDAASSAPVPCWIGNTDDTRTARIKELSKLIATRVAERAHGRDTVGEVVVVLDGALALRNLPGMKEILRDGPAVGVYLLCVDRSGMNECRGLCELMPDSLRLTRSHDEPPVIARPEGIDAATADRLARTLAPMRDRMSAADAGNAIPYPVRLLDLLGLGTPTADDVLALWDRESGPTTRAVLGADASGPVTVDLAGQGPHTMLGGAPGGGKSILLRTLVTSLLLANRPDELNLVLVDFKGGSAFLPFERVAHVTALIRSTGETTADVFDEAAAARMLASVRAEVSRRESVLARYGGEIDSYWQARATNPDLPALPRLVMIFDEFARVVETSPDFLKELVKVAAKGRSLGMHLVLATQSLQGKLSPEMKNNIELRITMRQNEPADSVEVLGVPDAASIPGTLRGRGMILCTKDETRTPQTFQCGYLGDPPPSGGTAAATVRVLDWSAIGLPRPIVQADPTGTATDQDLAIAAVEDAVRRCGLPAPFRPLLPALPDSLPLAELARHATGSVPASAIPFGLADEPDAQAQPAVSLDLAGADRLLVAGGPQSGRTTFVRALITSLATRFGPDQVHLYLIERHPAGLAEYAGLPHCGGVFSPAEPDRIRRVVTWLDQEKDRRTTARLQGNARQLPHLVVVIDGWEHFENRNDPTFVETNLLTMLRGIVSAGAPVGIHIVSVGGQEMLNGRLPSLYPQRLLLAFPQEETRRAHLTTGITSPARLPGRGVDAGTGRHVQVCQADTTPTELVRLARERAGDLDPEHSPRTFPGLPVRITMAQLPAPAAATSPTWIPLGVGGSNGGVLGIDLFETGPHLLLVSGPSGSGRTTAVTAIAHSLRRVGIGVVAVVPPRSRLAAHLPDDSGVRVVTGFSIKDIELREAAAIFGDGPYAVLFDDADHVTLVPSQKGYNDMPTLLDDIADPSSLGHRAVVLAGDMAAVISGRRRSLARIINEILSSGARVLLTPAAREAARDLAVTLEPDQYFAAPPGRGYYQTVGAQPTLLQLAHHGQG